MENVAMMVIYRDNNKKEDKIPWTRSLSLDKIPLLPPPWTGEEEEGGEGEEEEGGEARRGGRRGRRGRESREEGEEERFSPCRARRLG
eukprot:718096-Hanusia_phi.AAC.1